MYQIREKCRGEKWSKWKSFSKADLLAGDWRKPVVAVLEAGSGRQKVTVEWRLAGEYQIRKTP